MLKISRDNPCLFLTAVTKDRLPVFRTDALKAIACAALDEARRSAGLLLLAYVIMPDHLHALTDGRRKPSDVLRFIKGIMSHRVIEYLKQRGHHSSLEKLRRERSPRGHEHSLWQHHSNVALLISEAAVMERVRYVHWNPVREGLAEKIGDYRWSSARCWMRCPLEDEPLMMDLGQIAWRR